MNRGRGVRVPQTHLLSGPVGGEPDANMQVLHGLDARASRSAKSAADEHGDHRCCRPSSGVSRFPRRTPIRRTPFTRRIPAANSGLRRPASAASYATRRTAASRKLIVAGAYPRLFWVNSVPEHACRRQLPHRPSLRRHAFPIRQSATSETAARRVSSAG